MKKLMLTAMVVIAFLFTTQKTEAQVRLNVNLNVGRPSWGLPGNYSGDYYYLPEIDSYYDIPRHQFVYFDGRGWVYNQELPYQYRDYNLFGGYKVIVNEPRPYLHADVYRQRYSRYYNTYRRPGNFGQGNYGNRNDRNDNNRYNNGGNGNRNNMDRNDQHFDNKRREAQRNDNLGRNNGHDNGNARGRKW
jgi:hypothetical protein